MVASNNTTLAVELLLKDMATKDLKRFGITTKGVTGKASRDFKKLDKSVTRTGAGIIKLSVAIMAIRTAVRTVHRTVGAGFGFVAASADFEEASSKFSVVFGDFANSAARDLDQFAELVGRPKTALIDFASTFQDTLVPMGIMRGEAAELSVELVKLATDAASFGNKLDSDAVRDFQSALVGNHETVRKYGIVITEANLQAEAYRLGLVGMGEELSNVDKIQARLSLIQGGLSDAIGDAARTAGSYQNTMKRLGGEIMELRVIFGNLIQEEILRAIEELGGLDRVVDSVKLGFAFLTGVTRKFIGIARSGLSVILNVAESLGGVDDVARFLAGDFLQLGFALDLAEIALKSFAKATAEIFIGIDRSARVLVDSLVHQLGVVLVAKINTAMVDVKAMLVRSIRDIGMVFGPAGAPARIFQALFDLPSDEALKFEKMGANAFEQGAKLMKAPAADYESIWANTFKRIAAHGTDASMDFLAALRNMSVEGVEFDFDLDEIFPPREKYEPKLKEMGAVAGSAWGVSFATAAELIIQQGIKVAPDPKDDEDAQRSFLDGWRDTWGLVQKSLSSDELGSRTAADIFGALEGGIDDYTSALVDGKASFSDFRDSLLRDIAQIILKMTIMQGLSFIPGFKTGGVMGGDMKSAKAFAEGGIMPGSMGRRLPVNAYAQGGIATTPQMAIFGEGPGAEAFVPLGGDRKIPVKIEGGGGNTQATIQLSVQSLDPSNAADVVLREMPAIQRALASALQSGRSRPLTNAVRSTARGGR